MARIVEGLSDCPAVLFSGSGEVLWRSRPAVALFGGRRCHLLVDPEGRHLLLVLTTPDD